MKKETTTLRLKYSENVDGELILGCPLCDFEYNHVEGVKTQKGNDNYDTDYGDIFRGDAIIIKMECEEGHKYNIIFGEHKGYVYMFAEPTK